MEQEQKTALMPQVDQETNQDLLENAKDLLVQGKRLMALNDFQAATDLLEQSCRMFDTYYGVAKRECADAYYEYGLALVSLADLEAGSGTQKILKKAGIEEEGEEEEEGEDEEGEDEEEEEGEEADGTEEGPKGTECEENGNVKVEENGQASKDTEVPMDSNEQKEKTNGVDKHDSPKPQTSSSAEQSDPTPGTSNGATGGDKDDESVDNEEATTIEVAWEVLCLAKRLFMADESMEGRLKLADTLHKLGEISIEWENNDNAVSILEECLNIRTAILKPDDRLIATTYYHLGLAHSFKSDTQTANENFQKAIDVIEKRVASLSEDLEKAKACQDTVAVGAYQMEMNELKELLPEMSMRLDDSKEDDTKSTEVLKRTREEMQQEDEEAKKVCLDRTKPVDDIGHLVKRKAA